MAGVIQQLRSIAAKLAASGIDSSLAEAEIILETLYGVSRAELYSRDFFGLDEKRLAEIVERRCHREPLQYILGEAYFMNLVLHVEPGVLIPRPETELLVERVCREAPSGGRVCDTGTGSGAIALAVAYERPDLEVTALDISPDACRIAERNRQRLNLSNVRISQSDLFAGAIGKFNVIAANLPYISDAEYETLQPEVREHEPVLALTSGKDGLDLIRRAVADAPNYLLPGGMLILEIGAAQGRAVCELLQVHFHGVEIIKDYNNLDRHVLGLMPTGC